MEFAGARRFPGQFMSIYVILRNANLSPTYLELFGTMNGVPARLNGSQGKFPFDTKLHMFLIYFILITKNFDDSDLVQ